MLCGIRRNFFRLSPCYGQIAYVLLTRAPVAGGRGRSLTPAAPRLACVKPVASVHPEPGSNSSLLFIFFLSFLYKRKQKTIEIVVLLSQNRLMSDPASRLTYFVLRIDSSFYDSCTTLVYCKSFNVLGSLPVFRPKTLQSYGLFLTWPNFSSVFFDFSFFFAVYRGLRPKSECKVTHFP